MNWNFYACKRICYKIILLFQGLIWQITSTHGGDACPYDNHLYRKFPVNNGHVILSNLKDLSISEGDSLAQSLEKSSNLYVFASNLTVGGNIKTKGAHISAYQFQNNKEFSLTSEKGGNLTLVAYNGKGCKDKISLGSVGNNHTPAGGNVHFYGCNLPDTIKITLQSQGANSNIGGESGTVYFHYEGEKDILKNAVLSSITGKDQDGRNRTNGNLTTAVHLNSLASKNKTHFPFIEISPQYPTFFLHPVQTQMVLEGLRHQYIFSSHDQFQSMEDNLKDLLDKLSLFNNMQNDHPIALYYKNHETEIGAVNSLSCFQRLFIEAGRMYNNCIKKQDFYGHDFYDVPLMSFSSIKNKIEKISELFSDLEEIRETCYHDVQEQKESINTQESILDHYNKLKDQLEGDVRTLKTAKVPNLKKEMENLTKELSRKKNKLSICLKKFEEKLHLHSGFSVEGLLEGCAMVCFCAHDLPLGGIMAGLQTSKFLYDVYTKIKDDRGMLVEKKYIISSIKYLDFKLDNMPELVKDLQDGHVKSFGNNQDKIIVQKEQFERVMFDFYSKFPDEFKEISKELDAYIALFAKLNSIIMDYNATLDLIVDQENKRESIEEMVQKTSDSFIGGLNLSSPHYFNAINILYNSAKEILLSYFNKASRSYRFWALTDDHLFLRIPRGIEFKFFSKGWRDAILISMEKSFMDILENSESPINSFPAEKPSYGKGVTWSIDDKYFLERLKKDKEVLVRIPAVFKETKEDEAQGFFRKSNIRLDKVYVWLEGAKSKTNTIFVDITHTGTEDIVDTRNKPFHFTHSHTYTHFEYRLKDNGDVENILQEANLYSRYDSEGESPDKYFAKVGPFTYWKISVPKSDDNIDLSGLTSIRMEFFGSSQAFK